MPRAGQGQLVDPSVLKLRENLLGTTSPSTNCSTAHWRWPRGCVARSAPCPAWRTLRVVANKRDG
ncbi:hypothetical protein G4Z16_04510 [Streptomyces bathyalis]|uniref:Uncharacterized protein n=1 Tax=Streptomyces bathyalis TaxID=2710756 RepID=A0A7T1T3Q1_9ACTN|nr:hypothetical protein [Streptomyces bathyalis]QPP05779.1 hypothetical protein G4Z16_04510 [Streptomyces bathyalis]